MVEEHNLECILQRLHTFILRQSVIFSFALEEDIIHKTITPQKLTSTVMDSKTSDIKSEDTSASVGDVKKNLINTSVEDIQNKLDKKLGPEYISKRVGYGANKVAYIEGWRAINLANQIFGYNGWKSEIKQVTVDFLDSVNGKHTVGCSAVVRVTLSDGTYREDLGYGCAENEKRKAQAFEKAKKTAVTDGLKRAFREFGNALGNCLYDKQFLSKIDSVKFDPPDFDENSLFRPADEISESITRQQTMDQQQQQQQQQNDIDQTSDSYNYNYNKKRKIEHTNDLQPSVSAPKQPQYQTKQTTPMPVGNTSTVGNVPKIASPKIVQPTHEPTSVSGTAANVQPTAHREDDYMDDSLMSDSILEEEMFFKPRVVAPAVAPAAVVPNNANSDIHRAGEAKPDEDVLFKAANEDFPLIVSAKTANDIKSNNSNLNSIENIQKFDHKYQTKSIKFTVDQNSSKPLPRDYLKEKGVNTDHQIVQNNTGRDSVPPVAIPSSPSSATTVATANATAATATTLNPTLAPQYAPRRELGKPKTNYPNLRR